MVWAQRIFGGSSKTASKAISPRLRAAPPPSPMARLVGVAHQPDQASRSHLAQQLSDICLASGRNLSARERTLFFDILRHLIHQVEMQVRKSLAERLSVRSDAPHDLVFQLANDVIEVAYPLLVKSMVLDDADLIELILSKAEAHQQAITKRPEVSLSVTETLVGTGNDEVIQSLLKNEAAEIMPATMMRLVDQSLETESFREVLLRRRDMKPELARRMYTWVGDALREYINDSFDLSQDDVDDAVSLAISEAMEIDPFDDADIISLKDYASAPLYEPTSATLIQSLNGLIR